MIQLLQKINEYQGRNW